MITGKVATALLSGLAAGVVVSLLYAPKVGEETRGQIKFTLSNLGNTVKKAIADQADKLNRHFQLKIFDSIRSIFNVAVTDKYPDYLEFAFI